MLFTTTLCSDFIWSTTGSLADTKVNIFNGGVIFFIALKYLSGILSALKYLYLYEVSYSYV